MQHARRGVVEHTRIRKHVAGDGKFFAMDMALPVDASRPGVGGNAALGVHDMELPVVASVVGGNQRHDDRFGGHAIAQKSQAIGSVKRVNQRLRCDGANAGSDEGYARASRKKPCRNGNAKASGRLVAGNDRPRHTRLSEVNGGPAG